MQARRQKCRELIRRYYRDIPSREELLDQAISEWLRPSHVLLDAGCGAELPLLARYGPQVSVAIGVDLCPPAVRVESRLHVVVADLERLPLDAEAVDLVISRSVFEHVERPIPVFGELYRMLRPGGRLIFTTPNKYYLMTLYWLGRIPTVRGHEGLLLLSVLLILMGVQFITFGLIMEVLSRIFFQVRRQRIYAVREVGGADPLPGSRSGAGRRVGR